MPFPRKPSPKPEKDPDEYELRRTTEDVTTALFLLERFERMGFSRAEAAALVGAHADWHRVESTLSRWSHAQALEVFL